MGLKFDKTKEHGIVYGHPGIAYEQDGHQFGFDGELYSEGADVVNTRSERMKASWAKRKGQTDGMESNRPAV